jgi:D-xylulose reductase
MLSRAKEASTETVFWYAHVYSHALALMSSVRIDVKPLISRTFEFRDSIEAFDFALKMTAMVRQAPQNDRNVDPVA